METLKLYWLGPPLIELKERAVRLETRKATALLAYLSLNLGVYQRERLATMFWPEANQQKALASLCRTLSSLHSCLPGWIQADHETITLKRTGELWVDVEVFHQLFAQFKDHRHPEQNVCADCLSVLDKIVNLYRGDFLEGLNLNDAPNFAEWQFFQQQDLRAKYEECNQILEQEPGQAPNPETVQLLEQIRSSARAEIHRETGPVVRQAAPIQPAIPLLKTKFFMPKVPEPIVARPRLLALLNKGMQLPLTILSAPAGFGKTTLVSEWISTINLPTTWLSLDQADDDPGRFFTYLIAALQKVNENIGCEIESVLQSGQLPPLPIIAANLINDILAVDTSFILVLDDFQVIQDQVILRALETVLASPPKQLHLVLITREDPLLPLGRLRANHQMNEIRGGDLRFSEQEVDLFLNGIMGLSLSEGDITTLENRTEGWAAGLQLAAIAMHDRVNVSGFISHLSGSHRYILSYLTEEVLSRQTEDIQTFLLQTSILDKLCGELCEAVTRNTNSSSLLEKSFHANLFLIPLDDEGRWYRYHHLFRDLLLNQQSRMAKQELLELHRRASQWYEEAGMISESMEHALIAADYPHAIQLLEDHAPTLIMQGYLKTVEGWMQTIPSEWQPHSPRANLAFAWMYLLRGSYERVVPYLQQVAQAISEIHPVDEAHKSLRAEWLALQATLLNVQGNPKQGIELANEALQWTSAEDHYVKSLIYAALGGSYRLIDNYVGSVEAYQLAIQNSRAGGHLTPEILAVGWLTIMAIQHGNLHFAYEVGSRAIERLEQDGGIHSPMVGAVYVSLGITCYEWNQLEKATSYLLQAIHLSSLSGHNSVVVYAKVMLARVLQAQGDSQAAARTAQEAAELLPLGVPAWLKSEVVANLVRIYLLQHNPVAVEAALHSLGMSTQEAMVLFNPFNLPGALTHQDWLKSILSIRLIHHKTQTGQGAEELQQATELASGLAASALSIQHIQIALQALLLRAQMCAAQGNMEVSLDALSQAIKLAESQGYMRTFLDEGQIIADLLIQLLVEKRIEQDDRQVHFIQQLLACFASTNATQKSEEAHSPWLVEEETLVEPLTDREMDVLRLIAKGLKYQEIAGRLFITLNTVRFYVKEIYGKLNANNRTQAIEAAHKHNLL